MSLLLLLLPSGSPVNLTGAAASLTLAAPSGVASTDAVPAGNAAGLTLTAPAGATATAANLTGVIVGLTLTAPGGAVTLAVGATAASSSLTLAAPAGAVNIAGMVDVTGAAVTLTLTAPAGAVSVAYTAAGIASGFTLAAPAGQILDVANLPGFVVNLTLTAPAGAVSIPINVSATGTVARVTLAARAGLVPLATPPGVEVRLYDSTGLGSYTVLPSITREWRDELSKRGSGRISVPIANAGSIAGRTIAKFDWLGAERYGIVIDSDACTVAAPETAEVQGQRIVEASGPGLLALTADAAVHPEYPLARASGEDRRYGYMSLNPGSGSWHDNVAWSTSIYTPVQLVDYPRWPVYPADFPDSAAAWIGVGNVSDTPGGGYSWFRREFFTFRAYGAVRLAMCADDTVEWYLDGELLLNVVGDATILNSTYTADALNLAAGSHVLAGRVTNAFQPRDTSGVIVVESADGEVVASLLEVLDPLTVSTGDPMYGDVLVRTDAAWECLNDVDGTPGWHWAQILLDVLWSSDAAGAYLLSPSFTETHDSAGQPWTDIQDLTVPVGTSLLDLCEQAGEVIDTSVNAATMTWDAYVRQGVDRTVALEVAGNLAEYDTARTASPVNVALGHLADGTWVEVVDETSVIFWGGRIERRFDLGSTADRATAVAILQQALTSTGAEQFAFTARPGLLAGATPYADYGMGDSVLIPGHRGVGQVLARVLALNVSQQGETVEAWPELVPHGIVPSFGGSTGGGPPVDPSSARDVYVTTPRTPSSGVATVNWTPPVTAGQTGYILTLDGSHGALPTPGAGATTGALTGLTAGYVYTGTLTATYATGPGVSVEFAFAADPAVIPPPSSTKFGTSINGTSDLGRWAAVIGHPLDAAREFFAALPASWGSSAILSAIPTATVVVLSFKSGSPASVTAFLNTRPMGQIVYVSWAHEPEDDYTSSGAWATYRATWASYGPAIRTAGCTPTLILMAYTLNPGSGRNWRNYYQASAVDAFGWDAYNPARKHSPPGYTDYATVMVPKFEAVAAETGKPWGVAEHGSPIIGTDASRVTWATATHAALTGRAAFALWWDSSGPGFDNTASNAVMGVWAP